ncbi:MAG: hypothetical protein ACK47B_26485 [Armatimonadota bacterium]
MAITVHTICDRCGREYEWEGVTVGQHIYCCAGCASGTVCTCPFPTETVVVSGGNVVVAGDDDVIIVK